jgi:hypothetical protein
MAAEKTFREACSEKLGIPPEDFEQALLWRCFPPKGLFFGKLCWNFNRRYFNNDLELLQAVADCTSVSDLLTEISNYRFEIRENGFLRTKLHLRLSGQRLADLAGTLLPQ